MSNEVEIIRLEKIMEEIRKSEIAKIVYRPYFAPSSLSIVDVYNFKITKPLKIGGYYINNISDYSAKKISPILGNIATLNNDTNYEQHLSSAPSSISYSSSKTTSLSIGLDIGKKFSISSSICFAELSEETSLEFHVDTTQSYTETQTITQTIPCQTIMIPPKSTAHVKAIMERMEFTGNVEICVGLSRFEEGIAYISQPKKENINYKIDMLSHIAPSCPIPFPDERKIKPITFKELKKGRTEPVELWTTGKYKIEHATRLTVNVVITPIGGTEILNSYSIEL